MWRACCSFICASKFCIKKTEENRSSFATVLCLICCRSVLIWMWLGSHLICFVTGVSFSCVCCWNLVHSHASGLKINRKSNVSCYGVLLHLCAVFSVMSFLILSLALYSLTGNLQQQCFGGIFSNRHTAKSILTDPNIHAPALIFG